MTAVVDTDILVRHLTGDPLAMAKRATAFLAGEPELYLADLIVAETVYVLESFHKAPRDPVATAMRSLIALRSMITVDAALLLRAIEVYEVDRLDFAEAERDATTATTVLMLSIDAPSRAGVPALAIDIRSHP